MAHPFLPGLSSYCLFFSSLKAEQIKDFIPTSFYYIFPTGAPSKPWNPNDSMEKHWLETDLSHQLDVLKQHEEAQYPTLFI
eukprot:14369917-Ditylum_brightwellii.AAC.1